MKYLKGILFCIETEEVTGLHALYHAVLHLSNKTRILKDKYLPDITRGHGFVFLSVPCIRPFHNYWKMSHGLR